MITQIDVESDNAFELPILGVTPKSSLLIKKITGLNPPDKTLFIGDYSQDGGIYQGRRVGSRNVVMTIDLNPNPALGETVASLRRSLYKAFNDPQPEGEFLKILMHDEEDNEIYFVGFTEKFETELFEVDTMCQISMICPDPYLRSNEDTVIVHPTGFVQFPFSYEGTAETGFIVRIYVTAATGAITLSNNGRLMKLVNPAGYVVGDIIIVNTIRGERSITLSRPSVVTSPPSEYSSLLGYSANTFVFYGAGVWKSVMTVPSGLKNAPGNNNDYWQFMSTPIVSQLDATSQWLELHSANNTMQVYEGDTPNSFVANIKYLKYTSAYWGM